jgi:hypothetical protein
MAVRLNRSGYKHAQDCVRRKQFIADDRDAWNEHQPSTRDENEFIRAHGFREYSKWHLGINDERDEETKQRYNSRTAISRRPTAAPSFGGKRRGSIQTLRYRKGRCPAARTDRCLAAGRTPARPRWPRLRTSHDYRS